MVERFFKFDNGTEIDLSKIICIGAFDKDQYYNYFFLIYCVGLQKPIPMIVCNSIGGVSPELKERAQRVKETLTESWKQFIVSMPPEDPENIPDRSRTIAP